MISQIFIRVLYVIVVRSGTLQLIYILSLSFTLRY